MVMVNCVFSIRGVYGIPGALLSLYHQQGGFAHCYELIDSDTGTVYAGKIVPKASLTKPHQRDKVTCLDSLLLPLLPGGRPFPPFVLLFFFLLNISSTSFTSSFSSSIFLCISLCCLSHLLLPPLYQPTTIIMFMGSVYV